jgi:hypothetical protein
MSGWVTVISLSGCYIRTEDTLDAGAVTQLCVQWHEMTFETWARVAHAIHADGMGIAFFDTKPQQIQLLNKWIEAIAVVVKP